MANKIRQLRRTVVRALSDPDSFKTDIWRKRNDENANSDASLTRAQTAPGSIGTELPSAMEEDGFVLQDAIDEKKSEIPLRLICTEDGKLYDRNAIEAWFRTEYSQFFDPTYTDTPGSSVTDTDTGTSVGTSDAMRDAVNASFAYAMLSHRWEMVEPLYKDLDGSDAFSLDAASPGARKLQHFCRCAREQGFRWAWSDTCCIDKTSTSELQKSIISMFKWYRNSDLTIVYLGDVSDNSIEAFKKSIWFLRGWTLQELIAPHRLLVFQSDWTPLITSVDLPIDNYKSSPTFRNLLADITGIDDASLTQFDPTARQPTIRQRMSWAARRKTTESEDTAYCLMGIFDVHFPVMYGEGLSAFHRLQVEIMTKSDDTSLFDWTGRSGANSLLAALPACFDPFAPPIIDPIPATMRLAKTLHRAPFLRQVQRGIDQVSVGLFNIQERVGVNAQHPANYIAGAKIHCHGLEYSVMDAEEAKATTDARAAGGKAVYQYHIIAESLHPVTVNLAEPIETGFGLGRLKSTSLCLFRVWDQSLATGRSAVDDGNHPLRQPFVGHLLISEAGGIYRRIQVKERIVAKLLNPVEFRMIFQLRTLMIQ